MLPVQATLCPPCHLDSDLKPSLFLFPPLQRSPRLYVPEALLGKHVPVPISTDQRHYLLKVMRLRPGAYVRVFNRRDGEWIAVVADEAPDMEPKREIGRSDKKRTRRGSDVSLIAKARIREGGGEQRNDEGESKLRLCFAPLKRARLKILFEKATEMGVTHLQPVLTEHTDVAPRHAEEMMKKMEGGLVEAAEQCERIGVPEVLPAMTFDALLEEERGGGGRLYICREREGARPIMEVLERDWKEINEDRKNGKKEEHRGTPSIVIGPEGGFSPRELAAMKGHPRLVSLGPSVLRAETAGLVAVGVYVTWQEARSLRQKRQKISPAE